MTTQQAFDRIVAQLTALRELLAADVVCSFDPALRGRVTFIHEPYGRSALLDCDDTPTVSVSAALGMTVYEGTGAARVVKLPRDVAKIEITLRVSGNLATLRCVFTDYAGVELVTQRDCTLTECRLSQTDTSIIRRLLPLCVTTIRKERHDLARTLNLMLAPQWRG